MKSAPNMANFDFNGSREGILGKVERAIWLLCTCALSPRRPPRAPISLRIHSATRRA